MPRKNGSLFAPTVTHEDPRYELANNAIPFLKAGIWAWEQEIPPTQKLALLFMADSCDVWRVAEFELATLSAACSLTMEQAADVLYELERARLVEWFDTTTLRTHDLRAEPVKLRLALHTTIEQGVAVGQ